MINLEFLRLSWETIRNHKIRSALTLLGIVIGVFAIIVAVTAVKVIESEMVETIESFGSTTFYVESKWEAAVVGTERRARTALTYEQMIRLADRAELPVAISPNMSMGRVEARYADRKLDAQVRYVGSNEYWALNNGFELAEGRFLGDYDVRAARPVAVIGEELNDKLFPNETALGKDIIVAGARFNVIGVFDEKGDAFGNNLDNIAVVPITRMIALYSAANRDIEIVVRAADLRALDATMDEVTGLLRVIRRVRPGEPDNFEIESNQSFVEEVTQFTDIIANAGAGIGLITLLAAGVGIMNIMLVSVTERTREIGVRKSVGATRRNIASQFLYEAIFLCQIGGAVGILTGVLAGNIIGLFVDTSVVFPWMWALLAVLGVTAIALIFGVYPAFKAAGLDPIDALRYE